MKSDNLNYLNIGLIVISCVAAFVLPFEVFLIAYALLGPLHYLTEISWLKERHYFAKGNWVGIFFTTLASIIFLNLFFSYDSFQVGAFLVSFAFLGALAIIIFKKSIQRIIAFSAIAIAAILMSGNYELGIFFGYFIPTLIHVFIFTGAFMLYGTLKERSRSGSITFFIFLLCAISFFIYVPNFNYTPSTYALESYKNTFFSVNAALFKIFHVGEVSDLSVFGSSMGIALMRFIAFAYLYHYLNWFSKTSIIKWHLVPRNRMIKILAFWMVSVALYLYDYRLGFVMLYFLSMLHVFLEFPLNHISFIGIGRESMAILKRSSTASSVK